MWLTTCPNTVTDTSVVLKQKITETSFVLKQKITQRPRVRAQGGVSDPHLFRKVWSYSHAHYAAQGEALPPESLSDTLVITQSWKTSFSYAAAIIVWF